MRGIIEQAQDGGKVTAIDFDVTLVGAGPAGAATATHLASAGWRVLLLDKARFPRDKVCGEALSPAALPLLARLGALEALEAKAWPIRGARLVVTPSSVCEIRYPALAGCPDYGLGVSRLSLDTVIVACAERQPTLRFEQGQAATALLWEKGRCVGIRTASGEVRSRAVVLAEGRFSRLHPRIDRRARPHARRRRAFVATFEGVSEPGDLLELRLVRPDLQLVMTPLGENQAALCAVLTGGGNDVLGPEPLQGLMALLREDPKFAARLERARPVTPLKGLTLDPYRATPLPADGLVAVGDTTGFFDPLTGEGMYRALRSAELAARTLDAALRMGVASRHSLAAYDRAMEAEFRWTYRFVATVVALSRSPSLASLAVRTLARRPDLAARMAAYQGALLPAAHFFPDILRTALAAGFAKS